MGFRAWVRSSTDQLHNIAVQGPKPRHPQGNDLDAAVAAGDSSELGWFRFAVGRIGDFEGAPVVVSRTGYTGELGYEIFCHPQRCARGVRCGVGGGRAARHAADGPRGARHGADRGGPDLRQLRVHRRRPIPFEAGIGFTVPLESKAEDFIGSEALIERKEHPRHKLVGLDIDANEAVGHGDCVHVGRAQIGVVTSSACARRSSRRTSRWRAIDVASCGARHRGRDRQARWPAEALAGGDRAVPALRSREEAGQRVRVWKCMRGRR